MVPKKEPSEPCEWRLAFQTSIHQANAIEIAASRMKISVAEWLRQAAKIRLKRQKL